MLDPGGTFVGCVYLFFLMSCLVLVVHRSRVGVFFSRLRVCYRCEPKGYVAMLREAAQSLWRHTQQFSSLPILVQSNRRRILKQDLARGCVYMRKLNTKKVLFELQSDDCEWLLRCKADVIGTETLCGIGDRTVVGVSFFFLYCEES